MVMLFVLAMQSAWREFRRERVAEGSDAVNSQVAQG
jgi:hypothetical protein